MDREMRVDLAIFKGDFLLSRNEYHVRSEEPVDDQSVCHLNYRLTEDGAEFIFSRSDNYPMRGAVQLPEPFKLFIPAVESTDWCSNEIGNYTFAYWCRLGA